MKAQAETFPTDMHQWHQMAVSDGCEDKSCEIILCSFLGSRNEMATTVPPVLFWEVAAVWLQPILEENSVKSCLLEYLKCNWIIFSGLVLNVNVFIATSPDYILIMNIPSMLADPRNSGKEFASSYSLLLVPSRSVKCFLTGASTCPISSHPLVHQYADQGTEPLPLPLRRSRMVILAISQSRVCY